MNEIDRWYDKTWITKGARFKAAERLNHHDLWSTISISILSCYLIGLNVYTLGLNITDANFTILNIILGIILVVISLIVTMKNFKLRASKFHDCARDITRVYDQISYFRSNQQNLNTNLFQEISDNYNNILERYDINHSDADLKLFKANNIKSFIRDDYYSKEKDWSQLRLWVYRKMKQLVYSFPYYFQCYFIYFFIISIPMILFFVLK